MELGILLMSLCRVHIDSDLSEVRDWVSEKEIFPFMLFLIFLYCVICILKTTELSNSWDYLLVFPHSQSETYLSRTDCSLCNIPVSYKIVSQSFLSIFSNKVFTSRSFSVPLLHVSTKLHVRKHQIFPHFVRSICV